MATVVEDERKQYVVALAILEKDVVATLRLRKTHVQVYPLLSFPWPQVAYPDHVVYLVESDFVVASRSPSTENVLVYSFGV